MITEDFAELEVGTDTRYKIWYRLTKSAILDSSTPILLLHGGPGLGSDYLEPLETLAEQGRTVVRFDQLGCGRSDRPRDLSLWTIQSCIKQIEAIRKELKLDCIHLLGHSWGGMVALEYLLTRPSGVRSACLCSSVVDVQLWSQEANRLRLQMPSYISKALDLCAKSLRQPKPPKPGTKPGRSLTQKVINRWAWLYRFGFLIFSHPLVAVFFAGLSYLLPILRRFLYPILDIQFTRRHECRLKHMPLGLFRSVAGSNEKIHGVLMGPSDFYHTGLLKDWDISPSLPQIYYPTLIISGRYDKATPTQMEILKNGIANSEQIILEQSSHCGMWEEPHKFRTDILDFVNRTEGIKTNRGYMGKILWVDLSQGQCEEEVLPEEVYERFLSGMGLAAYILYKNIPPKTDPLGPDNILGFVPGLLTGTGSLFTGRWMVVGKSPLTGTWGEANCGGDFSPAIKQCGYDGIFFKGKSDKPVYLYADHGKAELRDASGLWGKDTFDTVEILTRNTNGKKPRIACIGPAGERLSLISGIANDKGRMAARSGLGAVMGSKNLKAVVLAGSKRVMPNNREEMHRLSKECTKWVKFLNIPHGSWISNLLSRITKLVGVIMGFSPLQMRMDGIIYKSLLQKWGTTGTNLISIKMGDSPIKNWNGSSENLSSKGLKSVDPDLLQKSVHVKYHCYSCPLGCGGFCYKGKDPLHRPEYETILALGGLLLNEEINSIFSINDLLNRAGMDTISAGGTVAFAIECFEKGILTKADTDGLELKWGNTEALTKLFEKMVARQGIGDLLADGSKVAAKKLGKNSIQYAIQAGGQELPMHDGRRDPGFALHSTVEAAPGRHSTGSQLYYEMFKLWEKLKDLPKVKMLYLKNSRYKANKEKTVSAVACSCYTELFNSAGLCMFGAFLGASRLNFFEWLNAATGWEKTPEEYMEIGKRIQTLKQLFNFRHGIDPMELKVSERAMGNPPLEEGPNQGRKVPLDQMVKDYWLEMGWDPQTGKPTRTTLKELEILELVERQSGVCGKIRPQQAALHSTGNRAKFTAGSKPVFDKEACVSCNMCIQICPVSCLSLSEASVKGPDRHPYMENPALCIACGFCAEDCPVDAIRMEVVLSSKEKS